MDNQIISLPLPPELDHSFFFSTKIINVETNHSKDLSTNFMYEILYYNQINGYKPWENNLEAIPQLLKEWEKVERELEELHKSRNAQNTLQAMKKGVGIFIEFLFWSNDLPVSLKEPIPSIQISSKPINVVERLGFIISRPKLFHSFRQLSELIIEQEKLFAKKNTIKKASKPKS